MPSLAGIDLNLLVALDALLEMQNVTRAGRQVGLSQSAMSSALGRLRTLFGDPLLVRVAGGMSPTPLATALRLRVRRVLQEVQGILQPPGPFDPRIAHRFRIAVTDYVGLVILPGLAGYLHAAGSALDLEARNIDGWELPVADLDSGRLDLAVSFFRGAPSHLRREVLINESFVCAVRRGHPVAKQRLALRQFTELPHLLVAPRAEVSGVVDAALSTRGLSRRVAVTVPHFLAAPAVLAKTNCVATLPTRVAQVGNKITPLRLLEPPLRIRGFAIEMVWHPQAEDHPPVRWLREQLRLAARGL